MKIVWGKHGAALVLWIRNRAPGFLPGFLDGISLPRLLTSIVNRGNGNRRFEVFTRQTESHQRGKTLDLIEPSSDRKSREQCFPAQITFSHLVYTHMVDGLMHQLTVLLVLE